MWVAFGEGSPAGVAVETVADNRRDDFPDNRYALPATHEIEAGGPARLHQNFPVERLVAKLKESGIAARASSQAGHYLCEEMLYELLFYREKSQDQVPATVLFIHVPPWDSLIQTTANEEVQADEAWFRQLAKIMMPTILAVVGE